MDDSVKVSNSTVQLRNAKQEICLSRSNWLGLLSLERKIKLYTFLWDNCGPGGRKDVVKGLTKVIPNPFTVIQTLLNIAVVFKRLLTFSKGIEVDYSLICVSTMHHLEHCQFCIIIRFCFGTELHCAYIWILNDLVIQPFSYTSTNTISSPVLVMSWSVVIVN